MVAPAMTSGRGSLRGVDPHALGDRSGHRLLEAALHDGAAVGRHRRIPRRSWAWRNVRWRVAGVDLRQLAERVGHRRERRLTQQGACGSRRRMLPAISSLSP